MSFFFLPFLQNCLKFSPVRGDHFLFYLGSLDDHRDFVIIGTDEGLASFKLGNGTDLCPGQLQGLLHILGLIRFQIQNNFILRVINDRPSIFAVIESKEIRQILRR